MVIVMLYILPFLRWFGGLGINSMELSFKYHGLKNFLLFVVHLVADTPVNGLGLLNQIHLSYAGNPLTVIHFIGMTVDHVGAAVSYMHHRNSELSGVLTCSYCF